jgi:Beta-lactamase enzyme family
MGKNSQSYLETHSQGKQQPHPVGLSRLQFASIATAVASGVMMTGLITIHLMTPYPVDVSVQLPTSVQETPTSSVTPLSPKLTYNVKTPPKLQDSQELKTIINEITGIVEAHNLPIQPLSITLINVKDRTMAGYQQDTLRFPASVVKMFWLVILYSQIEKGLWSENDLQLYLSKMLGQSDNEAASHIVDLLTDTQSGGELYGEEYQNWLHKRQKLNVFFQLAGYQDLNISQKPFPIPYLKLLQPAGRELQMRQNPQNPKKLIRNQISTTQASRLLYEMFEEQVVSPKASKKMLNWLKRDLDPKVWQIIDSDHFNPIKAFFGESLPQDVSLVSKAGWTSSSRQEAALITTPSGECAYILVVFGDDPAYAQNLKIFPQISRHVYERMSAMSKVKG